MKKEQVYGCPFNDPLFFMDTLETNKTYDKSIIKRMAKNNILLDFTVIFHCPDLTPPQNNGGANLDISKIS